MSKSPAKSSGEITTDSKDAKAVVPARVTLSSSMAASMKGKLKPLRIVLPVSVTLNNNAANTLSGVLPIDLTASSEWTNLQALYDEYRFVSGVFKFSCVVSSANAVTADSMPVFAWDPVDSTVLTNTRNGCELFHHQLYAMPNVSGANGVVTDGKPYVFKWQTKLGNEAIAISAAGAVSSTPGMWKSLPSAGSNFAPDGYMKTYWSNANAGTTAAIVGIMYYTVDCRSRK